MFDSNTMIKSIPVLRLIQLLQQLPAKAFLEVSIVGNLKITIDNEYSGFVDFNHEKLDIIDLAERKGWNEQI